jgi:hypothetical protein
MQVGAGVLLVARGKSIKGADYKRDGQASKLKNEQIHAETPVNFNEKQTEPIIDAQISRQPVRRLSKLKGIKVNETQSALLFADITKHARTSRQQQSTSAFRSHCQLPANQHRRLLSPQTTAFRLSLSKLVRSPL